MEAYQVTPSFGGLHREKGKRDGEGEGEGRKGVVIRRNPYSLLDYQEIFENIHHQYIDENGKMRGLTVKIGKGKEIDR